METENQVVSLNTLMGGEIIDRFKYDLPPLLTAVNSDITDTNKERIVMIPKKQQKESGSVTAKCPRVKTLLRRWKRP